MKKTSQVRKRKAILVTISFVLLIVLGVCSFLYFRNSTPLEAKEEVTLEYGEPVKLDPALFLKERSNDPDAIVLETPLISDPSKYTYNEQTQIVTTKGKDVLDPGIYPITLKSGHQEVTISLKIEDQSGAEFIDFPSQINVEQNAEDFDLSLYFLATAKNPVTIETPEIDISAAGNQIVPIEAKVEQGEGVVKNVQVNVLSYEEVANGGTLSSMINGLVPLSQATWDALNSGEQTSISIASPSQEISAILERAKKGTLKEKISYKEPKNVTYFDPKTFKPNDLPTYIPTEPKKEQRPATVTPNTPSYSQPSVSPTIPVEPSEPEEEEGKGDEEETPPKEPSVDPEPDQPSTPDESGTPSVPDAGESVPEEPSE